MCRASCYLQRTEPEGTGFELTCAMLSVCQRCHNPCATAVAVPHACREASVHPGCGEAHISAWSQGGLYFWSYVYYLSKFYEFFDTILNVLKVCHSKQSEERKS